MITIGLSSEQLFLAGELEVGFFIDAEEHKHETAICGNNREKRNRRTRRNKLIRRDKWNRVEEQGK